MRRVSYTQEPGGVAEGTLLEFLMAIPNLLHGGILPPLRVLNNVLARGEFDAGPGGAVRWEPFQLTQAEFVELSGAFDELSEASVQAWDAPAWVQTYTDWSILLADKLFGVPAGQHRALHQQFEDFVTKRDAAIASEDEAGAKQWSDRADEAASILAKFLQEHLEKVESEA